MSTSQGPCDYFFLMLAAGSSTQRFVDLFSFQDFNIDAASDSGSEDEGGLPAFMRHPGAEVARRAERALAAIEGPEAIALPVAHRDTAWACARACLAMEMDFVLASDTCIAPEEFGTTDSHGDTFMEHTYGEITCDAVDLLARVFFEGERGSHDASVIDLGSGLGKIAFQLAMIAPGAREMIGVELAKSRHDVAVKALEALEGDAERAARLHCPVRLVCGDVCDDHYRGATHAFANSLLFSPALKLSLCAELDRCEAMRMVIATTTMPLSEERWTLRPERLKLSVSWDTTPTWDGFVYIREGV